MNLSIYKYMLLCCIAIVAFISCSKFDQINTNPDTTNTARSEWLATSMLGSVTVSDISTQKHSHNPSCWVSTRSGKKAVPNPCSTTGLDA